MARAGTRLVQEQELADIDNWAVVGGRDEVRAGLDRYRERIGMTHVIARCGVPDAAPREIEESIRSLAKLHPPNAEAGVRRTSRSSGC